MIFIILAATVILGEPTVLPNADVDCVKPEPIPNAAPHPHKRVIVKHSLTKRLFKADPKPVAEDCDDGPRLPPLAGILPIEPEYTPVPLVTAQPIDVSMPVVPGLEGQERGCACEGPVPTPGFTVSYYGPPGYWPIAPPVPEPGAWLLMAGGLALVWRKRCN